MYGKETQSLIASSISLIETQVPRAEVSNQIMIVGIFSKIKQLVQKVWKGLQWANDNIYKPFIKPFTKPILGALGPIGQTIGKGLDVASSFLDYGYGADKMDSLDKILKR
ncbi:MAG: hypothetical protein EZS28_021999 [Streblomastix strix]|uniref:Uncharacterized protein n=1 Tax=Streblomastix strix TaxID=222440 RepID=A0A5J4VJ21_9EUKA|nr:MAG: hypothetical protein EZS28_021999 [Streblomastix strix]